MRNPAKNSTLLRLGMLLVAGALAIVAGVTFYNMAAIPTDENVFVTSPSSVFVSRNVPATPVGDGRARVGQRRDDSLRRVPAVVGMGDQVVAVGNKPVKSFEHLLPLISVQTSESILVRIYRPTRDAFYSYMISRDLVDSTLLSEVDSTVVVVDVAPGGASDRAGMRIGDIIVRINGKGFRDSHEADAVLRRGESGVATVYDVVREGQPLSLAVTLARFGFPLGLLVLWLAGLLYMAFGATLLVRRPELTAARTLGFMFLSFGFVMAVAAIRREPDPTWFTRLRDVLTVLAGFIAITTAFHSKGIFPAERRKAACRRWILPMMYGISALSPLLLLSGSPSLPWIIMVNYAIAASIVAALSLEKLSAQHKRMIRPITIVAALTVALTVTAGIILGLLGGGAVGFIGFVLILIPLSYAYVLGRYRLLGLDFRVRRNVQYTLLSWGWGILMAVLFVRLLLAIPGLPIQIPVISISGLSVEVDAASSSPDQRLFMERLAMIVLGVVTWYVLWRVRKGGQQIIDRKYYRTQFDYRRAATSLSNVLSTRLSMNDTARGTVDALASLMNLKQVGLLVFRNGEECCCEAVAGLSKEEWNEIACIGDRDFAAALASQIDPVGVELLDPPIQTLLSAHQFSCVVPIRSKERLAGALLVGEKLSETPFRAEDLSFLTGVAKQLSVSIENAFLYEELAEKERMRHELGIARRIQLSSLPSETPRMSGLDIAGMSSPALEVGGDFFDYLNGAGTDLMVIVGDVSGKGTSAALYMSKVQGILRSLYGFGLRPRDLFIRVNRLLCKDLERSSFVTALGAHFTSGARQLTLVRAGHVPLFVFRAQSASVERILPRGLGLGLDDAGVFAAEIEERAVNFTTGDVMLFVTDGVLEARNVGGEEFGDERLSALLSRHAALGATALRDAIVREIQTFGEGTDQHDDQTVVVVKSA